MSLEECVKYWQDQVGPDSEEDKRWGANLGAIHWEMFERFERMLERTRAAQEWMAAKESSQFDMAPLKMHPRSLLFLYKRLLEEYKTCRPLTAWELIDTMKTKIEKFNASRVVPRINELFAECKELADLQHWYINSRLRAHLEGCITHLHTAPLPVFQEPAAYADAIQNRQLSVPMGTVFFGEEYSKFIKEDILKETQLVNWEEGSDWHSVVLAARQWAEQ